MLLGLWIILEELCSLECSQYSRDFPNILESPSALQTQVFFPHPQVFLLTLGFPSPLPFALPASFTYAFTKMLDAHFVPSLRKAQKRGQKLEHVLGTPLDWALRHCGPIFTASVVAQVHEVGVMYLFHSLPSCPVPSIKANIGLVLAGRRPRHLEAPGTTKECLPDL